MSKLLTLAEAAERLHTPEPTLRYWVTRGEAPPSFKLGRRRMFRADALEAWLSERENAEVA
jgi:excisionase family DNA binding protein